MLNATDQRNLAHARALRARGLALPPDGPPSALVLDSWARCMDQGLSAEATLHVPVVDAQDLAYRREQSEFVRRLAKAELETLSRQIAGSNFLLAFADSEGVILDLFADNRFNMSGSDASIVAGSCWTEGVAGTNGLGTALATQQAVAVTGLEHYFLQLGRISCTAAPVHDAFGQLVGALDASSYYESRQSHTRALVQMAATHIENGLLVHQMSGRLVLALHPRAEYLSTLSAGLLAFDDSGSLLAMNGAARMLLSGLDATRGAHFESLFGEPMDLLLARLHVRTEAHVRDALGSLLVARMVGRPRATRPLQSTARHVMGETLRADLQAARPLFNGQSASPAAPAFLADDPEVAEACRLVAAAVRLRVPILLQGETGTGKELLARHAHHSSGRRGRFVAVNCAAIPAELFEAELFGYAAGAYTGARREGSEGLIRAADGGTLLLDEVRDLPLAQQAALLRFLDDQQVRPVGASQSVGVDVQVLAACHANLQQEVAQRRFREDLLYRLTTVQVNLPPLRQRRDVAAAVRLTLSAIDAHVRIDDMAVQRLVGHDWPGNFRELRSVLTRLLLNRDGAHSPISAAEVGAVLPGTPPSGSVLQRSAAELVRQEYERSGHSVSQTSRKLGISRTTVYRHLKG